MVKNHINRMILETFEYPYQEKRREELILLGDTLDNLYDSI
jgi:hypothetical protein